MDDIDRDKLQATLERLEAELARRLAEKIAAGEIVSVPLCVAAGSEAEARAKVEGAKAAALKELRDSDDQREIAFSVTLVKTGVRRHGEAGASTEPWKPVSPPYLPGPSLVAPPKEEEAIREEPQAPLVETYIAVQVGRCLDDDDPGQIAEGWYSIDGKVLTVTNKSGGYVGSRTITAGEDPKVVAKQLLREKQAPEEFNRPLDYPLRGWT